MILNVPSVVSFFLSGLGAVLALATLVVGSAAYVFMRRSPDALRSRAIDDRLHLLVIIVGVLGVVRVIAWPHFYLMLKSYVDELALFGVMCVFGVTKIQAGLVLTVQLVKPLFLLAVGFWWLLGRVDNRLDSAPFVSARVFLTIPLALLAMLDCGGEIMYVWAEKVGQRVTCCTQFLDTQGATLQGIGGSLASMGAAARPVVLSVYIGLNCLTIFGVWLVGRDGGRRTPTVSAAWALSLGLLGICNLFATYWAWQHTVAPIVLQLPYHHCVYELLTDTPAFGLAAVLAIAGNGCLLWSLALQSFRRRAPEAIVAVQKSVYRLCGMALTSQLIIVGVNVL